MKEEEGIPIILVIIFETVSKRWNGQKVHNTDQKRSTAPSFHNILFSKQEIRIQSWPHDGSSAWSQKDDLNSLSYF